MICNKETISRLKFIGKVQIGEKIDIKNMILQTDGIYTQLSRTINQESKQKTLVFLQDTINKSLEILKCYNNSPRQEDKILCARIVTDLNTSKTGLLNLKETYTGYDKFCCDIDVLLEMIDAKLSEMRLIVSPSQPIDIPPPPPFNSIQEFPQDLLENS